MEMHVAAALDSARPKKMSEKAFYELGRSIFGPFAPAILSVSVALVAIGVLAA